ncbi:MAG TPA: deoxyribose-phosphate aldolase, partial [Lachnoclostridium sp.]|nr:deoxyribose-phosphate aldolase [Lachnoclostridium sp.]
MKLSELTEVKLANLFDHTCLKACAVKADFDQLCREAKE